MTNADAAELLLRRLQDREGPWGARVADLLIRFALERPVAELVSTDDVATIVTAVLLAPSIRSATDTHVKPAWRRQQQRAREEHDTVGDALPPEAVNAIETIIKRGEGPRFAWMQGAVEPKLAAQLIAPIVQQVLLGFVTRLSGNLGGVGSSSASLMGMLGRGVQQRASALADVGKAMISGIGVDVDKKLQGAAKDFSETASATIRDALQARLKSPEGQALVQQMGVQIFKRIRETEVHIVQDDFSHLPIEEIIDLVPGIVAHNRDRAFIGRVIGEEVQAAFATVGHQTLGELLDAHGLRSDVEAIAIRVVPPTLATFFAAPEAATLVRDLLSRDEQ